jgi:hypothetical protein
MSEERQKRKGFLSVHRPIVTVDRTKLSFRIERIQSVKAFSFLILKTRLDSTPTPRHQVSAVGGGVAAPFCRTDNPVDKSQMSEGFLAKPQAPHGEERTAAFRPRPNPRHRHGLEIAFWRRLQTRFEIDCKPIVVAMCSLTRRNLGGTPNLRYNPANFNGH